MDLFIETPRFAAPGETLFGKNFRRASGGKGANQAYTISRMGMPSAIIGAVGADLFGDEMIASTKEAGVDTSGVVRRKEVATGTAVVTLDASGQNIIIVANGANFTLTATDVRKQRDLFSRSKAVLTQLETSLGSVQETLELGRHFGLLNILNPAPYSMVPDSLLSLCDWLIPNEIEAARLSDIEIVHTPLEAAKAVKIIRQRCGCKNICVTLGGGGVWVDTPEHAGLVPGFKVEAVDTVGAGDTFIGAFVTRIVEGASAEESARFGCAAAAISVTRRGAQTSIPTRAEVEKFLKTH
jgi:ribokinase